MSRSVIFNFSSYNSEIEGFGIFSLFKDGFFGCFLFDLYKFVHFSDVLSDVSFLCGFLDSFEFVGEGLFGDAF